jgi:tetratricopeptide (TPR) repeat protein
MGTALGFLAKDRFWEGEAAVAETYWRRSAEHAALAGDRREEAEALTWLLVAGMYGPTPVRDALARCDEIGDRPGVSRKVRAMAEIERGVLEAMDGEIERGRRRVASGRAELESLGLRFLAAALAQEATYVERSADDARAAEAICRPAYEALGEIGETAFQRTVAAMVAHALYEQGDLDGAALFVGRMHDDVEDWAGEVPALRALLAARRGEHDAARSQIEEAIARVTRANDFLFTQAERYVDLADVHALAGRDAEAAAALDRADEIYLQKGWRSALSRTARRRASLRGQARLGCSG